jgi:uncharacterized protein
VRFWDASAVVPLLVDEPQHGELESLLGVDPAMVVWWGTTVECASALARREREGFIGALVMRAAQERLRALSAQWHEVQPTQSLRNLAERMLRVHPLRAADSLQLAAALVAAEHDPASLEFVCLDDRLLEAAEREGFATVNPGEQVR